jgi:hypothetical protein
MRTVDEQVEGALTGVEGDCQYVLFKVTVPPQVVIESIPIVKIFLISVYNRKKNV